MMSWQTNIVTDGGMVVKISPYQQCLPLVQLLKISRVQNVVIMCEIRFYLG